jgi:ribosomal protein S18 acetylase RimI-like enzyme
MGSSVSLKPWQLLSLPEQQAVLRLGVTSQQAEFAGSVERSVETCRSDPGDQVAGLAILDGPAVVGFLVLKRGASAPAWADPTAATVSAMRIDLSCQGRGIGVAALLALPSWVASHWPESPLLTLSVDEDNQSARRAYVKAGFVDHGTREQGRIGWVRHMSRPVGGAA